MIGVRNVAKPKRGILPYRFSVVTLGLVLSLFLNERVLADNLYAWQKNLLSEGGEETLMSRIPPPKGYVRVDAGPGSYAHWLRRLPVKAEGVAVHLFNKALKHNQTAHHTVIDIDVGTRDLQQCADAVMRLRAEYLYAHKRYREIAFNYTNGRRVAFTRYTRSRDYKKFRKYMTLIFAYAGTYSLSKELKPVAVSDMKIGDVFIKGGFPGHAVLVADMVRHKETGKKKFLLIQSFMPAQDMHVLRNPADPSSPWYDAEINGKLVTPEWTFDVSALKRF